MTVTSPRCLIKFCGLVRQQDVELAVELGVDAIGFVFYTKSPRFVSADLARKLRAALPASVQAVGLFVNQSREEIQSIARQVSLDVLQFHGDEPAQALTDWNLPVWRAVRMQNAHDLDMARQAFPMAQRYLLDAHVASYGGAGQTFDWSLLARDAGAADQQLVLSGGLDSANVKAGIAAIRPAMVDVSSGIQTDDPRAKDAQKMRDFVRAVANTA
jgi:phosphoribosylanthranilate isomerase